MTTRIERRYSFRGCVCCEQPANIPAGPALSRRSVLAGAAALGFSAAAGFAPRRSLAQAPAASSGKGHRIDVHHHIAPPKYVTEFKSELQPPVIAWSVSKSLDDMDKSGVATAITSVTTPGSIFSGKDGRRVARECNEFAARLVQDHPGRFGMFVALPLTDVEGSLREIEFGLDVLKADGVAVFTSYGDVWLGDPKFEPIMAELNRRKAVIYTHPDAPICCRDPMVPEIREPVIEYGTDTTRAIARVLFSGTAVRYRDMRWIFSHGGGTAPFLAERLIRTPSPQQEARGDGAERRHGRASALLLRRRADRAPGAAGGAGAIRTGLTDSVGHGLSVPLRQRIRKGVGGIRVQRRRPEQDRS